MAELNNEVHDSLQTDWSNFVRRVGVHDQYLNGPDPDIVLRRGLMEEAHEMASEHGADSEALDYLKGEIGDVLYYIAHTAERNDIADLRTSTATVPVFEATNTGVQRIDNPLDIALVHILRINDVLLPRNDSLWMVQDGSSKRSDDLRNALETAMTALGQFADENGFSLSETMAMTADKLDTRARKPHVIEEQEVKKMLTSGRERAISSLTKGALRVALQAELALMREDR